MPEEVVVDESNDITAAVFAAAEVVRQELGLDLSVDDMPDPNGHHLFSWMQGRKWFNLHRVKVNVHNTLHSQGLESEDWEGIFRLLIPEITHVCFTTEDGIVIVSPWNDGYDF